MMKKSMRMITVLLLFGAFTFTACDNGVGGNGGNTDTAVTLNAIDGVDAPVTGAAPVTAVTETAQYTGTVAWSPEVSGTFAGGTAYTATITLTVKSGYILTGVAENFFTVDGATASNPANSGVISAVFPATAAGTPGATSYTVTYNANGGTGSVPVDGTAYEQGATVTVQGNTGGLTRTGYAFAGWNTASDGSGTPYAAGTTFTMGAAHVTLYAEWRLLLLNMITVISSAEAPTPGTPESGITTTLLYGIPSYPEGAEVILSYPFAMSETEITQAQYTAVMGGGPSENGWTAGYGLGDNYPAYYVTWYEVAAFCNALSTAEGKTPAYYAAYDDVNDTYSDPYEASDTDTIYWNREADGYRLPTAAEWEYAARGGNGTTYTYAGSNDISEVAWWSGNADDTSHEVKTLAANGYGLYDMSGNVREWCWDRYSNNFSYSVGQDPEGPATGSNRFNRGGAWDSVEAYNLVTNRNGNHPSNGYDSYGFRVVCTP